jgi:hypothetical protein
MGMAYTFNTTIHLSRQDVIIDNLRAVVNHDEAGTPPRLRRSPLHVSCSPYYPHLSRATLDGTLTKPDIVNGAGNVLIFMALQPTLRAIKDDAE